MSIVTPTASKFPIPTRCSCGNKFYKHDKRRRHVIEQGKVWYLVRRLRCPVCKKTHTLLLDNMLPHKHYAAPEIEQVLQNQEDSTSPPHECGAEESTLRRWRREFPQILTNLTYCLLKLANVSLSLLSETKPLQRLYNTIALQANPPPIHSRLAWAFFMSQFNPVHIG